MTVTSDRTLVLTPAAVELRRQVGPTAWVVLEATVAHTVGVAGVLTACVSARSLASELGLAKNTTARALSVLRDAGVLTVVQARDSRGSFTAGCYVVSLTGRSLELVSCEVRHTPSSTRTRRIIPVEQLSLLPR